MICIKHSRLLFTFGLDVLLSSKHLKLSSCSNKYIKNFGNKVRRYSRYSASTIMNADHHFSFSNYDCIGFDLDHTLCNYKITELVKLEYDLLTKFLVEKKKYDPKYLLRPIENYYDFLQKGLILDFCNSNILRLDSNGKILKACHGTTMLTDKEVEDYYGSDRYWCAAEEYVKNPLAAWNSSLEKDIRASLDYFDIMAVLCFAHCTDALDSKYNNKHIAHNIYPDILEGMIQIFTREYFAENKGYYGALKSNPSKYYHKCDSKVISWLKLLKQQNKTTFLITGSHVDFASFSAEYALGKDWMDLFDIVVFYARKPGFFTQNRPFYGVEGLTETDHVEIDLENNKHVYSQGNWSALMSLMSHITGKSSPKTLYIGDNLIQDVYTPWKICNFDTVVISEEMAAEGVIDGSVPKHPDFELMTSDMWGSYFTIRNHHGKDVPSLWSEVIRKNSKICIPSLQTIASLPIDHVYTTFSDDKFPSLGFYPSEPINYMG